MKNVTTINFILGITALSIIYSCSSDQGRSVKPATTKPVLATKKCYMAVYSGDTAILSFTSKGSLIEGKLKFIDMHGNIDAGTIKGRIAGDTLLADYHYKTFNKIWLRNPIALLKKGNKLQLGVGELEWAWGRTYFTRNIPIDYDKGRYTFREVSWKIYNQLTASHIVQ